MPRTARQTVEDLPASYDTAIESASMNVYDRGFREDADDDGEAFWTEVLAEVLA